MSDTVIRTCVGYKTELEEPVTLTTQEEYPHLSKSVFFKQFFI